VTGARTGVVVLNYGDPHDTWGCLDSLEMSSELDLDIVVVDNAPPGPAHDRLREGVGRRAEVVASGGNLGYAGGNNLGIGRVLDRGAEDVLLLNPDTRIEPDTLTRLRRVLDKRPRCGIVGPRLVLPGTPARIWFDGGKVDRATAATRHRRHGRPESEVPPRGPRRTDYVSGAALLARADTFREVGLLPERYFMYYEETEWCLRAADAGRTSVVQPRARMTHLKRSGIHVPGPYAVYYLTRNRYFFARDYLGVDPELALAHLDRTLVGSWRTRVTQQAGHWLPVFEDLVSQAKLDAREGRDGRRADVEDRPNADGLRPGEGRTLAPRRDERTERDLGDR
jgi:GT2 family glycosyltransferase